MQLVVVHQAVVVVEEEVAGRGDLPACRHPGGGGGGAPNAKRMPTVAR